MGLFLSRQYIDFRSARIMNDKSTPKTAEPEPDVPVDYTDENNEIIGVPNIYMVSIKNRRNNLTKN